MDRVLVVSVDHEDTRVALLEDGELAEIYIERPLTQRIEGNIYKGRVENVLPGMQAAFVNIGLEKNAFLYVDDAYPGHVEGEETPHPGRQEKSISDLVQVGQEVIVQVAKEPTGTKGARVTRNLTLPGRYVVLLPTADYVGISRRIEDDDERERLKNIARKIKPRKFGLIVRTAAEGQNERDLQQDVRFLRKTWARIRFKARRNKAPQLLYKDLGLVYRVLRDELSEDITRIEVDDRAEYEHILDILSSFAPDMRNRVVYHNGKRSLFEIRGLEDEIEKSLARKVWLKSGGYLVIDQTEALTAIDVNTGKFVGTNDLEETIYTTNLEATREIARQIRLRDIGGIIIIDFIDMELEDHRQRIVQELEKHLRRDRTKTTVLGITSLGLVEMTRKKGRQSLMNMITKTCPYCDGRGRIMTEESVSRRVRRDIRKVLANQKAEAILVETHPSVASLLIGPNGSNLKELEHELGHHIYIRGNEHLHAEAMEIKAIGDKREVEEQALPVREGQVLQLRIEEPHVSNVHDGIARVEGYVIDVEGAGHKTGQVAAVEIVRAFRTYAKGRLLADPNLSHED